jgi:hypothetical protein
VRRESGKSRIHHRKQGWNEASRDLESWEENGRNSEIKYSGSIWEDGEDSEETGL